MNFPPLKISDRIREYQNYTHEMRSRVVCRYLFEGISHRQLDEDVLSLDSSLSRGWQSMGILHYLGLRDEHKGFFNNMSIQQVIEVLESQDGDSYKKILEHLGVPDLDLQNIRKQTKSQNKKGVSKQIAKTMKGQTFTASRLYYVNGVVYEVADGGTADFPTLAKLQGRTIISGNAKHPVDRVRTLSRLAEGVGLVEIYDKNKVKITDLGKKYFKARSEKKWSISPAQQVLLGKYILSDYYRTPIIYAITSLFELSKRGYAGHELSHQFAIDIGKDDDWNSEVTYEDNTKFVLNYITELGLMDIDEKDLLINDISKENRFQNTVNRVDPIDLPKGKLPRQKPKKTRQFR